MKVLKIVGIILAVLIVLVLILGLVAPKHYHVERSTVINAQPDVVWPYVKYWQNWPDWSPWFEQDSSATMTVEGQDGMVNSKLTWVGDVSGTGEMINTGATERQELKYHLVFLEPWESQADGHVQLLRVGDSTKVTWAFYGENAFPWNALMLFMSMDKMVGGDFERGLELLKQQAEEDEAVIRQYTIEKVSYPGHTYAAIRTELSFNNIQAFYDSSFSQISGALSVDGARITGAPSGLYYTWDEENVKTDLAAAIPVSGRIRASSLSTLKVPRSAAYSVNFYGPYGDSNLAHLALNRYLMKNNISVKTPVIEEYLTDPTAEPDTTMWQTRIYYLVNE